MRKAEAASNKDCPVKISVVAPPLYALTTQTLDKVIDKTSDEFFIDCIRMECYTICEFFMSALASLCNNFKINEIFFAVPKKKETLASFCVFRFSC